MDKNEVRLPFYQLGERRMMHEEIAQATRYINDLEKRGEIKNLPTRY